MNELFGWMGLRSGTRRWNFRENLPHASLVEQTPEGTIWLKAFSLDWVKPHQTHSVQPLADGPHQFMGWTGIFHISLWSFGVSASASPSAKLIKPVLQPLAFSALWAWPSWRSCGLHKQKDCHRTFYPFFLMPLCKNSWFHESLQEIRAPGSFLARLILTSPLRRAVRLPRTASWTGTTWDSDRNKKNREVIITGLCILPAPKPQGSLFSEMTAQAWISSEVPGGWIHTAIDTLSLGATSTTLPEPQKKRDGWQILPSQREIQQSGYREGGLPVNLGDRIQTESSMWSKLAETNSNPSHAGTEARQPCLKLHLPSDLGCPLSYMERKKDGERLHHNLCADGPYYWTSVEYQPLAPVPHDKSQSPSMFSGKSNALPDSDWVESLTS